MEKINVTRSYLETLSSTDLVALSDDYGIESDNIPRGIIITEILDYIDEQVATSQKSQEKAKPGLELPFSYNENKIIAVLRNPAWCYVVWDFKRESYNSHVEDPDFESFILRLSYHKDEETDLIAESFDMQLNVSDREQFVLLTSEYPSFHVSLVATFSSKEEKTLATSQRLLKPKIPLDINLAGLQKACSSIQSLSGLQSILKAHYNEHRQSFVKD